MSNENTLYPELREPAIDEAQALLEKFKSQMRAVADEVIGDFYCDVTNYIESDSWGNFRNEIMDGFKNYGNRKIQGQYDFKAIRAEIYKEYREDIIKDLNADILEESRKLKEQNNQLLQQLQDRRY